MINLFLSGEFADKFTRSIVWFASEQVKIHIFQYLKIVQIHKDKTKVRFESMADGSQTGYL